MYKFPTSDEFAVTSMEVIIEGKSITTKIIEKREAEEKYTDAVASGNTAVKMS